MVHTLLPTSDHFDHAVVLPSSFLSISAQVIRELRNGVKLKHVSETDVHRPLYEFALTPYEILMDDIRSRKWNLNKVIPDELSEGSEEGKKVMAMAPCFHDPLFSGVKANCFLFPLTYKYIGETSV